jgi:DNA-binding transcriptional MerR regulator
MEGFEVVSRLNQLVEKRQLRESSLEALAEVEGIQFGKNLKNRLNYLVTLEVLRSPEAVYEGRGRGGFRQFQRDALEALRFVHGRAEEFSLNEIAGIVKEMREDLTREACKKLDIERQIPDPSGFIRPAIFYVHLKCIFSYDLIMGSVVIQKIKKLNELIYELEDEIGTLDTFQGDVGKDFCKQDKMKTSQYIRRRKARKREISDWLKQTITDGEKIIEKIEAEAW